MGTWRAEGESYPDGSLAGHMRTTDSYDWLPGGFYLVDRGEIQVGDNDAIQHLWVFGYDAYTGAYLIRGFDGMGPYREYRASVNDRTWTLTGEWERATLVFNTEGNGYHAYWEVSNDGRDWRPLCDLTARRVG